MPADLDLGEDYTAPISRGAFARLAVETAALCRGTDTAELLAEYGLEAESVAEESPFADTADPYVVLAARMGLVQGLSLIHIFLFPWLGQILRALFPGDDGEPVLLQIAPADVRRRGQELLG